MSSFVKIRADVVVEACAGWLANWTRTVERRQEKLIAEHSGRTLHGCWWRLRRGRPATREEIIEYLKSSEGFSGPGSLWENCSWAGGFWAGKVKDLRLAALAANAHGDGFVSMSPGDVDDLSGYWPGSATCP